MQSIFDMDSRRDEIQADLQEFQRLLGLTSNARVIAVIANAVTKLQEEMSLLPVETPPVPAVSIPSDTLFRPIEKFAYDQEGKELKVYVTCLPSLKSHPQDKIQVAFTRESIDVKILDLEGNNYRFFVKQLAKPITDCKFRPSSSGFRLILKKEENSFWDSLAFKPSTFTKPKDKKEAGDKDPGSDLMDMMRDMYQNVRLT